METTLLVKHEAFVYRIPPQAHSGGEWKATGWNLNKPDWTGRLKIVTKEKQCTLRLEEKGSLKLYAQCPVDAYPGPAVQPVADSSRYFVIRVQHEGDAGKATHLGLGFADRSDSFDLNVALQGHFKSVRVEEEIEKEAEEPKEQLDLAFKEGETIKVNINIPRKKDRSRSPAAGGSGVLNPPPKVNMAEAVAAAGLEVKPNTKIAPPPAKANPNWIQF